VASLLVALAWLGRAHLLPERAPMERGLRAARALDCWGCHQAAERSSGPRTAPSIFAASRDPQRLVARIRDRRIHPAVAVAEPVAWDLAAWIAVTQLEADRARAPGAARHEVARAERLARRNCFGCHGELGQGGARNPGSWKGYVPGLFGRDFDLLTHQGDPAVVRQCIRDGTPRSFHEGLSPLRLGAWFTARQQVRMPAYAGSLRADEIETLVRYVILLRRLGPLDAPAVVRYRALETLPELAP